jgi:hypothetical protein
MAFWIDSIDGLDAAEGLFWGRSKKSHTCLFETLIFCGDVFNP